MHTSGIGYLRRAVDRLGSLRVGTVLALAVTLRLVAGLVIPVASTETYEFGRLAGNIADGNGYAYFPADDDGPLPPDRADEAGRWLPSAYMPPVYTYVAVAAVELGGGTHAGTVWALRGFNLVFAGVTVLAVRALARRVLGSDQAAMLAALGYAAYPPTVYLATQVSAANVYLGAQVLVLAGLLAAAARVRRARCAEHAGGAPWPAWLGTGVAMGGLVLVRSEALVLMPVAAVWLWWAALRGGAADADGRAATPTTTRPRPRPLRRPLPLLALFVAPALVLPGAWLVRSSLVFGQPTFTIATTGGSNLWIGNHTGASGSQKSFEIPPNLQARLDALPASDDYELRRDAVFRDAAIDDITADPLGTAGRGLKKLALVLGADIYDRRSLNPAYLGGWALLVVAGTAGLVTWWRERRADAPNRWLIAGFLAANIVVPVAFFALARYKLPIEVILLVFAAGWASRAGADHASTISPSLASTVTACPSATAPSRMSIARRSATSRWITRLRGRAPNAVS